MMLSMINSLHVATIGLHRIHAWSHLQMIAFNESQFQSRKKDLNHGFGLHRLLTSILDSQHQHIRTRSSILQDATLRPPSSQDTRAEKCSFAS